MSKDDNADVTWREFNIHGKSDNVNEEEEADDKNFVFHLFDSPEDDPYETKDYHFPNMPGSGRNDDDRIKTIQLRGQADIQISTGLALWLGSEVMCEHLIENPNLVKGKRVLELGAGLGLCGIACHYLGAKRVLLTDGDTDVLENLRHNVSLNLLSPREDGKNDNGGDDDSESGGEYKDDSEKPSSPTTRTSNSISCPQLIWGTGKNADNFKESFGLSDIMMATDCVYMPQSLVPLWQSVNELLAPDGIFLYANRCAQQVDVDLVKEAATSHQFTWEGPTSEGVYTFQRKMKATSSYDE